MHTIKIDLKLIKERTDERNNDRSPATLSMTSKDLIIYVIASSRFYCEILNRFVATEASRERHY